MDDFFKIAYAKEWATRVSKIPSSIELLRDICHELMDCRDGVGAIDYERESIAVQRTNGDEVMFCNAFRYEEKIRIYEQRIEDMKQERTSFIECCGELESPYGELLLERFVLGNEWSEVSKNLGYDFGYCRGRLKDKALIELWEAMPLEFKKYATPCNTTPCDNVNAK